MGLEKRTLRNECGLRRRCRIRGEGCRGAPRGARSRQGRGPGKRPQRDERQEAGGQGEAGTGRASHRTRLRRLSS